MKILSIDPGFERMGVAIIERAPARAGQGKNGGKPFVVYSACIKTSAKDPFSARLKIIGGAIEKTIQKYKPGGCAIEKLFFSANRRTALSVAEARGVAVYEAARYNLPLFEYSPMEIKVAVAGYGHATKNQIISMVTALVDFKEKKLATKKVSDDEFDAIAIGLTHLAIYKT
ncbi:MAG: crossover junction endodeoxyribonuclease RuvC [Parcubacteria group bacterium]|nr:crossover junction endodeoxyribonuclease RuvC [Parcubacteria group bacterium]MBI2049017.1 crossover junction endodeoxyribonuclease RuvC [Parcubacteria group bacterium]